MILCRKLLNENLRVDGILLIAPTKTLDFWSKEEMEEWEKKGVLMLLNKRTNQKLPQGKEYLEETKHAHDKWSIEKALKGVHAKFLILQGEKDEAIPIEEAITINEWNKANGNISEVKIIPNATHTFNTKHPFTGNSTELDLMLTEAIRWINSI